MQLNLKDTLNTFKAIYFNQANRQVFFENKKSAFYFLEKVLFIFETLQFCIFSSQVSLGVGIGFKETKLKFYDVIKC